MECNLLLVCISIEQMLSTHRNNSNWHGILRTALHTEIKPWCWKECNKAKHVKAFYEARICYFITILDSINAFNKRVGNKVLSRPNGSKSLGCQAKTISQIVGKFFFTSPKSEKETVSSSKRKVCICVKQFASFFTLNGSVNHPFFDPFFSNILRRKYFSGWLQGY